MASALSISTVSVNGNENYISGLASGMDTDGIIESLLLGTQAKIDKQTGPEQQLGWKQEIYRDPITKINTFGDQYFSHYSSDQMNSLSTGLFKTMAGISSSSTIEISSVSSSAVSSMGINAVKQLVTVCSMRTAGAVTGESRGNGVDFTNFTDAIRETKPFSATLDDMSRAINFTIEGKLSDLTDPNSPEEVDEEKMFKDINQVLYHNFGTSVGMKSEEDLPNSKEGAMKLVRLSTNGAVMSSAVDSSRRATVETTGDGDSSDTIANLGFKGRFSNRLGYGISLRSMNFPTPLQEDRSEFDINGVTIKGLNGDSTLSDVIGVINSSDVRVKVSYSLAFDKFIMEPSPTGKIPNIKMG